MRGLLSNLHLASAQALPQEQREANPALDAKAAIMDQSFYRLLRLVNGLSMAEMMDDSQPIQMRDTDLVRLVSDVCEMSSDLAELLGIHLAFVCAMDSRICAMHAVSIEQVLYQLLSNALKFTTAGGTVTVELKRRGDKLRLSVTDSGCGIPEDRMEHLFEACFATPKLEPLPYGLGLGLPLCRAVAERHGGGIVAESSPGKGSRFTLSLPDRQIGGEVTDVPSSYSGGFNRPLLGLADALPPQAFSYHTTP